MNVEVRQVGDATLYLGDCCEIMPSLAPSHLLVTDPPYLLTSGGSGSHNVGERFKAMGGFFAPGSTYANSGAPVAMCELKAWLPLAYAALAKDADAYVMMNDKNVLEILSEIKTAGFRFHNLLVWNKVSATPNRWYMKNVEFTAYCWKGVATTINDPRSKQLITCPQVDESNHPTEKPVALMAQYIKNSSELGDIVLDPFMGSGTTGVAALQNGRRFVGIEKDPAHFETAVARISAALMQPDLWRAGA